ncbi:MAG: hypothetical protein JWO53_761 [Chlamydiia bacterium]|nr:hypothetical protein [Chlamydiia bacterium]
MPIDDHPQSPASDLGQSYSRSYELKNKTEEKCGLLRGFFTATWLKIQAGLSSGGSRKVYNEKLVELIKSSLNSDTLKWHQAHITGKTLRWFSKEVFTQLNLDTDKTVKIAKRAIFHARDSKKANELATEVFNRKDLPELKKIIGEKSFESEKAKKIASQIAYLPDHAVEHLFKLFTNLNYKKALLLLEHLEDHPHTLLINRLKELLQNIKESFYSDQIPQIAEILNKIPDTSFLSKEEATPFFRAIASQNSQAAERLLESVESGFYKAHLRNAINSISETQESQPLLKEREPDSELEIDDDGDQTSSLSDEPQFVLQESTQEKGDDDVQKIVSDDFENITKQIQSNDERVKKEVDEFLKEISPEDTNER